MNENQEVNISSDWIVGHRSAKNELNVHRPYAWMVEKERTPAGRLEDTGVVFLTNKECSFKCLMCDLWKNTTESSVPLGVIPEQIEWALSRMPTARHLKLYNSGSFFDERAIPVADHRRIAELVGGFETVIVESHPNLVGERCLDFRDLLSGELEVAMGLEIAHPEILKRLNKQMTLEDFRTASEFLRDNDIGSRAFILLRPPFLTEEEGVYWAKRSIEFAFDCGIGTCTVIPVRAGNGAMEELMRRGDFHMPDIASLEEVVAYGLSLGEGRVFADLWDLELFSNCDHCFSAREQRLARMNLEQSIPTKRTCPVCESQGSDL